MENNPSKENPVVTSNGFYHQKCAPKYTNTRRTNQSNIDFDSLKSKALPHTPALLNRVLPGGKMHGHEYVALNPRRYDRKLGSFKFNTCTGKWRDWATGDYGMDIISLWAYVRGISQIAAARDLLTILGGAR